MFDFSAPSWIAASVSQIDVGSQDLKAVREILQKLVPARRVVVFGSPVTGRSNPFSDLDIADWATTAARFRELIARDAMILQTGLKHD